MSAHVGAALDRLGTRAQSPRRRIAWQKQGLIIQPPDNREWMASHAMVPFAERIEGDWYRVYFCGRDRFNRSLIGYAELDIRRPKETVRIAERPILGLGELGCFDDNGVTPSWIVDHGSKKYLYYIGWNQGSTVRMHLFAGLAISEDGGNTFARHARVPILERTDREPFVNTAPCVLVESGRWRMWYVAGIEWVTKDLPRYHIRYAESSDGIQWDRRGRVCIDFRSSDEHALARPCVIKEEGLYKMWYAYKGSAYRIGYAESPDGLQWQRMDDEAGIEVSESGWDSEMIEYAFVFSHQGHRYMLYNGNDYGRTGIGLAVAARADA